MQGTIPEPIISFNLGQTSFWLDNMTASLEIGGYDESFISGDIQYVDGYSNNYWAPIANGLYYGGRVIDTVRSNPPVSEIWEGNYKMAVLDTGTS